MAVSAHVAGNGQIQFFCRRIFLGGISLSSDSSPRGGPIDWQFERLVCGKVLRSVVMSCLNCGVRAVQLKQCANCKVLSPLKFTREGLRAKEIQNRQNEDPGGRSYAIFRQSRNFLRCRGICESERRALKMLKFFLSQVLRLSVSLSFRGSSLALLCPCRLPSTAQQAAKKRIGSRTKKCAEW